MGFDWYINEISAQFPAGGIITSISHNKTGSEIASSFTAGAKDIMGATLIVRLAGGIIIIMENDHIINPILYKSASLIYPVWLSQAAITMSIMAPFADLVNIPRQPSVMDLQI